MHRRFIMILIIIPFKLYYIQTTYRRHGNSGTAGLRTLRARHEDEELG